MSADPTIKTIIPVSVPTFAAYLPDTKNDIDSRIEPIVCFSLKADSDEVDGQIIAGELIVEASYVDSEDGFGKFLGYYLSKRVAKEAVEATVTMLAEQAEEEGDEEEEEEEEDLDEGVDGDEEEDEGEEDEGEEDDEEDDEEDEEGE